MEHVLSALLRKRADLSGDMVQVERHLAQLRTDLDGLDRTIRLFDPSAVPSAIRPRVRRTRDAMFPHGAFNRAILAVLRDAGEPLTARGIAERVAAAHGLEVDARFVARVQNALARRKDGAVASGRRDGRENVWWVAG